MKKKILPLFLLLVLFHFDYTLCQRACLKHIFFWFKNLETWKPGKVSRTKDSILNLKWETNIQYPLHGKNSKMSSIEPKIPLSQLK